MNSKHKVNIALGITIAFGIIAMTGTLWEVFTSLIAIITIGALLWTPTGWTLTWPILGGYINGTDAHAVALAPVVAIAFYGIWFIKIKVDKAYDKYDDAARYALYNKEPLTETMVKVSEKFDADNATRKGMALAKSLFTTDIAKLTQNLKEGNYDYGKNDNADVKGSEIKPGTKPDGVSKTIEGGKEHDKGNGGQPDQPVLKDVGSTDGSVGTIDTGKIEKKEPK